MGLKIGVVTPWTVKCGIYTYSRDLTEALAKVGVESYIVRLPRFGIKTHDILRTVAESIPLDKIDLVHIQHEYGLYNNLEEGFYGLLKRLEKPIVTTMHAVGNMVNDQVISDSSDAVIVHNKFCSSKFEFPEKVTIIPHGCKRVECPPPEDSKRSVGVPIEAPVVGYCGFISTYKGLEMLIDAMIDVPEAALLIGGGWHAGPETSYIMNLKIRSLELLEGRCMWLGYVPDEKLAATYGAMDLVVYPSRFSTESGALLMALGHGKAVLATSISPFKEKEELEALVTFKDQEDLRDKIRYFLKDRNARSELEAGARKYIEDNSWSSVAEKHLELYRSITRI